VEVGREDAEEEEEEEEEEAEAEAEAAVEGRWGESARTWPLTPVRNVSD
jgi:hypothetical protein